MACPAPTPTQHSTNLAGRLTPTELLLLLIILSLAPTVLSGPLFGAVQSLAGALGGTVQ
jgi:hypothetical protein